MLVDGGDVVLWGFLMWGMGFRCRIALLGGFRLVSLLMRLSIFFILDIIQRIKNNIFINNYILLFKFK